MSFLLRPRPSSQDDTAIAGPSRANKAIYGLNSTASTKPNASGMAKVAQVGGRTGSSPPSDRLPARRNGWAGAGGRERGGRLNKSLGGEPDISKLSSSSNRQVTTAPPIPMRCSGSISALSATGRLSIVTPLLLSKSSTWRC